MDRSQMPLERQGRRVALAEGRASENRIERKIGQAFHIHGERGAAERGRITTPSLFVPIDAVLHRIDLLVHLIDAQSIYLTISGQ
jgi:hypothetical protein